mmetsp:Transcript_89498/g.237737  ORF Transcript_89498/g.237737 Transcript_89498/m.237737 type:complete len:135 (-) Transcript_89498:51-455(-)
MGGEASKPAKQAASAVLRRAGEPLNKLSYPAAHEKVFLPPAPGKPIRMSVCRCWLSAKFPVCDNSHQKLQKQGLKVGPVMFEIKAGPSKVGASGASSEAPRPINLGGPRAALLGGTMAAALAGVAQVASSTPPF